MCLYVFTHVCTRCMYVCLYVCTYVHVSEYPQNERRRESRLPRTPRLAKTRVGSHAPQRGLWRINNVLFGFSQLRPCWTRGAGHGCLASLPFPLSALRCMPSLYFPFSCGFSLFLPLLSVCLSIILSFCLSLSPFAVFPPPLLPFPPFSPLWLSSFALFPLSFFLSPFNVSSSFSLPHSLLLSYLSFSFSPSVVHPLPPISLTLSLSPLFLLPLFVSTPPSFLFRFVIFHPRKLYFPLPLISSLLLFPSSPFSPLSDLLTLSFSFGLPLLSLSLF